VDAQDDGCVGVGAGILFVRVMSMVLLRLQSNRSVRVNAISSLLRNERQSRSPSSSTRFRIAPNEGVSVPFTMSAWTSE